MIIEENERREIILDVIWRRRRKTHVDDVHRVCHAIQSLDEEFTNLNKEYKNEFKESLKRDDDIKIFFKERDFAEKQAYLAILDRMFGISNIFRSDVIMEEFKKSIKLLPAFLKRIITTRFMIVETDEQAALALEMQLSDFKQELEFALKVLKSDAKMYMISERLGYINHLRFWLTSSILCASKKLPETPISDLQLSKRAYNCLLRGGIDTIEQLRVASYHEIWKFRNCGEGTFKEIWNKVYPKDV